MVETDHPELSIAQQCTILGISRSSYYYQPKEAPEDPDLAILEAILLPLAVPLTNPWKPYKVFHARPKLSPVFLR